MKSWMELLAALRTKCAYTGPATLESVKAFLAENKDFIELPKGTSVDSLYTKKVTISVGADAGEDVEVVDATGAADNAGDDAPPPPMSEAKRLKQARNAEALVRGADGERQAGWTPAMTRKAWERKRYNKCASSGTAFVGGEAPAFADADIAEGFGAFARLTLSKRFAPFNTYAEKSFDEEIIRKTGSTTDPTLGGALIPEEYLPTLIELREQYGKFSKAVGVTPMKNDRLIIPRFGSDNTVYWNGESVAATESDAGTDQVQPVANKLLGLSRQPVELVMGSAIGLGDLLARGFARETARKIDLAGFSGDGTSTYGGFIGLAAAFQNLSATRANIAGYVVGTGNLFSEITLADLNNTVARLPEYADIAGASWYMHRTVFHAIASRLGFAAGGVTATEVLGSPQINYKSPTLLGYPVEFVQVMPKVDANDQCVAFFGNLSLGCKYGEVSGSQSLDVSDQYAFNTDQLMFRYRSRCAIVCHDVGDQSATAASRNPGPIIALASAAA